MSDANRSGVRATLLTFGLGVVVGVVGGIVVPGMVGRWLPAGLGGGDVSLEGVVRSKEMEPERLLLAVTTNAGTVLATFTRDVAQLGLLLEQGDSVTLQVRQYEPFVENPSVVRVVAARFTGDPASAPRTDTSLSAPSDSMTAPATQSAGTADTVPEPETPRPSADTSAADGATTATDTVRSPAHRR